MALFVDGTFTGHAGQELIFKIECDALTPEDWATIARLVARKVPFQRVHGIPRGGLPFTEALKPYCGNTGGDFIVDDVFTTGMSMEDFRREQNLPKAKGLVLFARKPCPNWITSVFTLNSLFL